MQKVKILAIDENGQQTEITEIKGLGKGASLLIKSKIYIPADRKDEIEKTLSEKLKTNVVILDPSFDVIGSV